MKIIIVGCGRTGSALVKALTAKKYDVTVIEKQKELMDYLADDTYERDSTGSIGLKNIQQRLTMFCGKDYRLIIESTEGEGTLVKIPVPRNFLDDSGVEK